MFSDEFKELIGQTNENYLLVILDIVIALIITFFVSIFKEKITALDLTVIFCILLGVLLTQYLNNLYKTYKKDKTDKKKSKLIFEQKLAGITKNHGLAFNEILGHQVRTTVFVEEKSKKQIYLKIASRYNSYATDPLTSKWKVSHESIQECKGVVGIAWATGSIKKNFRLSGKEELKRLFRSEDPKDVEKRNNELRFLNMNEIEIKKRLEEADRKYLFPKLIVAYPVQISKDRKIVIVVDSDERNGKSSQKLEDQFNIFGKELKLISEFIEI